jgi:hypothetical protein
MRKSMMRVVLIFLVPLLVSCGVASAIIPTAPPSPLPSAHGFSLQPSAWSIQYSPSMPSSPSQAAGGWYFDFPQGPEADGAASVHYVTTPSGGGLASSSWLGAVFEIAETGAAVYQYKLKADNTCDNPAIVSLFLQQQGDRLTASEPYKRWWSVGGYALKSGSGELTVSLEDGSKWLSVFGERGNASAAASAGFAAAKQYLGNIGLTFGGGCFKGHGVNLAPGSGTSRFTLTTLRAE